MNQSEIIDEILDILKDNSIPYFDLYQRHFEIKKIKQAEFNASIRELKDNNFIDYEGDFNDFKLIVLKRNGEDMLKRYKNFKGYIKFHTTTKYDDAVIEWKNSYLVIIVLFCSVIIAGVVKFKENFYNLFSSIISSSNNNSNEKQPTSDASKKIGTLISPPLIHTNTVTPVPVAITPTEATKLFIAEITKVGNEISFNNISNYVQLGADVNAIGNFGNAPLIIAVGLNNYDIIKLLLKHGANTDAKDYRGQTALMLAIQKNNTEIAKLLIDNKADINAHNNNGETVLLFAIADNNIEIAKFLIKNGAEINTPNDLGCTPLIEAANVNNTEIVELLLAKGANVNASLPSSKQTALGYATLKNNYDMTKLLTEKGANVNVADDDGDTPLLNAVKKDNIEIVKLLVSYHHADVSLLNKDGYSALTYAAILNNIDMAKLLIDYGADPGEKVGDGGEIALGYAKSDYMKQVLQHYRIKNK